jgi:hypothetical protein
MEMGNTDPSLDNPHCFFPSSLSIDSAKTMNIHSVHRLRGIPLESVLRLCQAQPDRYDKHKWHAPDGVLSIQGTRFIDWHWGVGGGGAIDLVMHLRDCRFTEAVQWLEQHFPLSAPVPSLPSASGSEPCTRPLRLPTPVPSHLGRVQRYLTDRRHIPPALIQSLLASSGLYADRRANAVFLLRDQQNHPVGAELRGTTQRPWRGLAPGSRKNRGYFWIGPSGADATILCESAIDAISCFALYSDCRCISTSGARPNPAWLPGLIEQGQPIFCGFDADPTGDHMARAMIDLYPSLKRLRPPCHDWNDALCSS